MTITASPVQSLPPVGSRVRVVNPETGVELRPDATITRVERPAVLRWSSAEIAWVEMSPSLRPGLPHDLGSYPLSWLVGPSLEDRIDELAFGLGGGDGLEPDLFALLVEVAQRAVRVEVGDSASAPARARAVRDLVDGLRENLTDEFA